MSASIEERREAAKRLRELADAYENTPAWSMIACGELPAPIDDVMQACGLGRITHATEICARLADLIEPEQERTCRIVDVYIALPSTHLREIGGCDQCGERIETNHRYCFNCGAKVEGAGK